MKKIRKISALFFVLILCISSLTSCALQETVFSEDDFSITLPATFQKKDNDSFTYYYESASALVMALREDIDTLSELGINKDSTIDDYLDIVFDVNKMNDSDTERKESENGNYTYFSYNNTVEEVEYFYIAAVYKSDSAFWLVNFGCEAKNKDKYADEFKKWADSVTIK